jgi:hypothetical protein
VSGNATVSGSGVLIFNAGSNYPNSGGTFGAISLSGNGSTSLTPAATGSYAGVLIFQPSANTQPLTLSGNAMGGGTGTIYAPAAQFSQSGNAQISVTLDVDDVNLSGDASAQFVYAAAAIEAANVVLAQALPVTASHAPAGNRSAPAPSLPVNTNPSTIAAPGPVPQAIVVRFEPGRALAETGRGLDITAPVIGVEIAGDPFARLNGVLVDLILDEPAPELAPPLQTAQRDERASRGFVPELNGMLSVERGTGGGARPSLPLPAGPLAHAEQSTHQHGNESRLMSAMLVAGLCSFGGGLKAAPDRRPGRSPASRWLFKFNPRPFGGPRDA